VCVWAPLQCAMVASPGQATSAFNCAPLQCLQFFNHPVHARCPVTKIEGLPWGHSGEHCLPHGARLSLQHWHCQCRRAGSHFRLSLSFQLRHHLSQALALELTWRQAVRSALPVFEEGPASSVHCASSAAEPSSAPGAHWTCHETAQWRLGDGKVLRGVVACATVPSFCLVAGGSLEPAPP